MLRLRHSTWLRWSQARFCRGPIHVKSCSATWNTAAVGARRQLAICQPHGPTGCAGSPGENCPLRSFSCTICVMCRNTLHNCSCSWDNRWENLQAGHPRLSSSLHPSGCQAGRVILHPKWFLRTRQRSSGSRIRAYVWLLRARPIAAKASTGKGTRVVYDKEGIDPGQHPEHHTPFCHQRRRRPIDRLHNRTGEACPERTEGITPSHT